MESESLREFVKKIFSDEKTKAEFLSNPDLLLDQYELTDEEKKAVLAIRNKIGLVTNNSDQLKAATEPNGVWLDSQAMTQTHS